MSAIVPVNGGIVPGVQQINTNLNVPGGGGGALKGFMGKLGNLGLALSAGEFLGNLYKNNTAESDFVSGRGSGAQALVGKDQRAKNTAAIAETLLLCANYWEHKTSVGQHLRQLRAVTLLPLQLPPESSKKVRKWAEHSPLLPLDTSVRRYGRKLQNLGKSQPNFGEKTKEGDYGYEAVQSVVNPPADTSK